jgi:REP element-mobilizing transposase RayT
MRQLKLLKEKAVVEFGGTLNQGVRKCKRPIFTKSPIHFVLKAEQDDILLNNAALVENTIRRMAEKFHIKIYELGVHADHVHIINHIPSRDAYNRWSRSITGLLARKLKIKWRLRPYHCKVTWGRQFSGAKEYVDFNRREGNLILKAHQRVEEWVRTALKHWASQ